jgi:hypothetical protein
MLCVTVDVASAASATLTVRARVKVAVASRDAAIVTLSGGHLTVTRARLWSRVLKPVA